MEFNHNNSYHYHTKQEQPISIYFSLFPRARTCRVGAGSMAPGERARRLGAHARLATCVCGARARAVPSDRRARASRPRAHQVTYTGQDDSHSSNIMIEIGRPITPLILEYLSTSSMHGARAHCSCAARVSLVDKMIGIYARLGLSSRPVPLGAPPRDVVQQILDRAQDNNPPEEHKHESEHAMREIIAIAQTGMKSHTK
ncbi:unnamed protein product [Diatraea saccharalis]|uniref:Uncharacterized protein n=1 Tax=Diatraea saccharalis TaxID=40085 RepID=A0A9N9WLD7_9NEOP|nr:unnamed protein product [Diatraea saccharalis]